MTRVRAFLGALHVAKVFWATHPPKMPSLPGPSPASRLELIDSLVHTWTFAEDWSHSNNTLRGCRHIGTTALTP